MKQKRPLLIVTSCTRNYGWVTRAFLEGNTRWADYIVIVDQMSTDGTREMCAEYKNVVLVDDPDMTYKENTRAKMGFMRGRELAAGRDAIYFAIDIDEVMPANWMQTEDGKKILASQPGDMFQLEWANILPDKVSCTHPEWQYKVFHDNGMAWQETGEMQMHTPLLPYSSFEVEPTKVNDFPLLHFGEFHLRWNKYKMIYYQFLDIQQKRSKSPINIFRTYHAINHVVEEKFPINKEWLYPDVDIIGLVDTVSTPIFVQYMKEIISNEGAKKYESIDVWSEEFCRELGIRDPRSPKWKMLHAYLRATRKCARSYFVRGVDFILKKVC